MTAQATKVPAPPPEDPKLRDRIIPTSASLLATATLTYAGSYIPWGTNGTLIGLATGGVLSATANFYYEKAIRRGKARAARLRASRSAKVNGISNPETIMLRAVAAQKEGEAREIPWKKIAKYALAVVGVVVVATVIFEIYANRPISAVVQGKSGHGTTFGGTISTPTTQPAAPSASPSPSFSPSWPASSSASSSSTTPPPPSSSPAAIPTPSPTPTVTVSPTPTVTLSPVPIP